MTPFKISMVDRFGAPMNSHPLLTTSVTGDQRFCAYSHCRGECGNPALFYRQYIDMGQPLWREAAEASKAPRDEQGRTYWDHKAHGSMVACGPVWQRKRWDGERVYLPEEFLTEEVFGLWWR